jgi:hypothetical protein
MHPLGHASWISIDFIMPQRKMQLIQLDRQTENALALMGRIVGH